MKLSKPAIIKHFLTFRLSRLMRSNWVGSARKKTWKKNLSRSPFYSSLVSSGEFPLMNKELFMENFDSINTVGIKKEEAFALAQESEKSRDFAPAIRGISIGLSSGTSGNRGIFLTSKREKELWVAAVLDRVIGISWKKRKVAFFLRANNNLYEAVQSRLLAFHFFDIKIPLTNHFPNLIDLDPDILVGQPSVLVALAQHYVRIGKKADFTKVVSVAEVLEEDQRDFLTQVFGCNISQVYQCTEGFLAYTCREGHLHLNEDWLEIEKRYLDDSKTRFHPIITDYLRSSQPVVRYELNDILHEGPPCSCGSKSTVLSKIEGRSDDVFRFEQGNAAVDIYPDFIRRSVLLASEDIVNYRVTRIGEKKLSVFLEVLKPEKREMLFQRVQKELKVLFSTYGIEGMEIIKADLNHNPMNKFKRVKNEYSKNV
ncbi:adenylate cyclase [bacterium SCSIO 12741]|nr:adenylate cyclase [bacterium SCSIO 12741]